MASFNAHASTDKAAPVRIVGTLHSDNAGEFVSHEFREFLDEALIHQSTSPPHTHQLNGVSEYGIRNLSQTVNTEYGYGIRNTEPAPKYGYGMRIRNTELAPKYGYGYGLRIQSTELSPKYGYGMRIQNEEYGLKKYGIKKYTLQKYGMDNTDTEAEEYVS